MGFKFKHQGRTVYEMDHHGIGELMKGPDAQAAVLAAAQEIAAKDPGYEVHALEPKNRATASVVAVGKGDGKRGWWGQTRQAHLKLQKDAGSPPSAANTFSDPSYMGRGSPEYWWGEKPK